MSDPVAEEAALLESEPLIVGLHVKPTNGKPCVYSSCSQVSVVFPEKTTYFYSRLAVDIAALISTSCRFVFSFGSEHGKNVRRLSHGWL